MSRKKPEYIGSGTYGLVVGPAIPCTRNLPLDLITTLGKHTVKARKGSKLSLKKKKSITTRGSKHKEVYKKSPKLTQNEYDKRVSKIMLKEDSHEEFEITNQLEKNKILPKNEILLCKPNKKELRKVLSRRSKTKLKSVKTNQLRMLIPVNRGIAVSSLPSNKQFKKISAKKLYTTFLKALKFLKVLHKNRGKGRKIHRFVHRDLKHNNILYNIKKKEFTIIDFGFTELYKDIFDGICRSSYWVFPIDYTLIAIIYKYRNRSKEVMIRRIRRCIRERQQEYVPKTQSIALHNRNCIERGRIAIYNVTYHFAKTKMKAKKIVLGIDTELGDRFDTYGIGYILDKIMKIMDKDYDTYKNKKNLKMNFFYNELQTLIALCLNNNIITYPNMKINIGEQTPSIFELDTLLKGLLKSI